MYVSSLKLHIPSSDTFVCPQQCDENWSSEIPGDCMVSEWWSLNLNLGLHDYKVPQSNPHILLRRELEWQDGHSISQQVKGRARAR